MRRLLAGSVFIMLAHAAPAAAAEQCNMPEDAAAKAGGFAAALTTAIKDEFSCEGAYRRLELCQLGSSGDNALSAIVLSKCEPRFLPKASATTKAAYDKARLKCRAITDKNDGTLYQGQAAVCMAKAGRDFARKYGTRN